MTPRCWVPDCPREDTRPYLSGWKCPDHAPYSPTPPPNTLVRRDARARVR